MAETVKPTKEELLKEERKRQRSSELTTQIQYRLLEQMQQLKNKE